MMSAQENDLITRTGPGTPCGNLMRRYWQPAALVDELEGPRPVKPTLLSAGARTGACAARSTAGCST